MRLKEYVAEFELIANCCGDLLPWQICAQAGEILRKLQSELRSEYRFDGEVAIHKSALVEKGVTFKGVAIVNRNCIISANSYVRDGVFLGDGVKVGPSCEVKSSFIFSKTQIAHLNYVGNSLIGSHVNLEAGVVLANHFNERAHKEIAVLIGNEVHETGVTKFGALLGDYTRIGANSVTSPGTILEKHSVVGRLALVNQLDQTPRANPT